MERTIDSSEAFIHSLSEHTGLSPIIIRKVLGQAADPVKALTATTSIDPQSILHVFELLDIPVVQQFDQPLLHLTPQEAKKLMAYPYQEHGEALLVATSNPFNTELAEQLQARLHRPIKLAYAPESTIHDALLKTRRPQSMLEALERMGIVTPEEASSLRGKHESEIIKLKNLNDRQFAAAVSLITGYDFVDPELHPPNPTAAQGVPAVAVRALRVYPYDVDEKGRLKVLIADPRDYLILDNLRQQVRREIVPLVAPHSAIERLIERYINAGNSGTVGTARVRSSEDAQRYEEMAATAEEPGDFDAIEFVNGLIRDAARSGASDIHIEVKVPPGGESQKTMWVRFREDGRLNTITERPASLAPSVVTRIKIMAELDITERRLPQDGRIHFQDPDSDLDVQLRVSTIPTPEAEKVVMRILPKERDVPPLDSAGFLPDTLEQLRRISRKPYGILLITGPTGSGKTTSLFSILKEIARPDYNTVTVEDPIEYRIPGVAQTQVNTKAGYTFARALRAFLRQDPDIIVVGEIRDRETAQIASEAALTGHLVLGTLHTNDAPSAITRLIEMGVEPFVIANAVIGVLAQRLVRTICSQCGQPVPPPAELIGQELLTSNLLQHTNFKSGQGCPTCRGSGYRGRTGIHELMEITPEIERIIVNGGDAGQIRQAARRHGMRLLREDGLIKASQGITTVEEVLAVTME